jgi:hypothetical protein
MPPACGRATSHRFEVGIFEKGLGLDDQPAGDRAFPQGRAKLSPKTLSFPPTDLPMVGQKRFVLQRAAVPLTGT